MKSKYTESESKWKAVLASELVELHIALDLLRDQYDAMDSNHPVEQVRTSQLITMAVARIEILERFASKMKDLGEL